MYHRLSVHGFGTLVALTISSASVVAQETEEFEPYVGMRNQFVVALPSGWSVFDQGAVLSGKASETGPPVVFSATQIDAQALKSGAKESVEKVAQQLAYVEVGRIAGFIMERLPAKKGMSCEGFDAKSHQRIVELMGTDPMFGPGRTIREKPSGEMIPLGGCSGLRLRGKGTARTGAGKTLDVFAVSDGKVLYLFKLLNLDEHYPRNLETFESIMATLELTAASKKNS